MSWFLEDLHREDAEGIYDFYMDNLSEADPPPPEVMGSFKKEWLAYAHDARSR